MPYKHFNSEDRDRLQHALGAGLSVTDIAQQIGKHRSSVYREVSRNKKNRQEYMSHWAEELSQKRRRLCSSKPKLGNLMLMKEVAIRVRKDHSPEQIAGRLKLEHPNDPSWEISHESIYQYIYAESRKGSDLGSHLRQGHKKRRKRLSGKDKRGSIPNRISIDERPAIVESKTRIGDWEGDTVEGGGKKGYIGTFVDRGSKYLLAFTLKNKTADALANKLGKAFTKLPPTAVKTITVDNGKEFAKHATIAEATGSKVYFAHPYHSWERGLNEHTNGLLRQYFPKKMPLDKLHPRHLAKIVRLINNRPRKSLGYRTPAEVFSEGNVALQI